MGFDHWNNGSPAPSPEMKTHLEPMEYDERNHSNAPSNRRVSLNAADRMRRNASAKLANPLAGISHAQLEEMGASYARKHHIGDEEDIRAFRMGAVLAQEPRRFAQVHGLTGMANQRVQSYQVPATPQLRALRTRSGMREIAAVCSFEEEGKTYCRKKVIISIGVTFEGHGVNDRMTECHSAPRYTRLARYGRNKNLG